MDNAGYYHINRIYDSFVTQSGNRSRYFFVLDIQKDIARWSPEAVTEFGLSGEYVHGHAAAMKGLLSPEDYPEYTAALQAFSRGTLEKQEYTWRICSGNADPRPCSFRCYVLRDYTGAYSYLAVAITSKGVESHIDPTTGLPDEVRFLEHLREIFSEGRGAIVLLMGTGDFSEVNALYGYTFGNKVISNLAERMKELTKESGTLFRGQGTTLLYCTETMNISEVQRTAAQMKSHARHVLQINGTRVTIHLGAGIVIADDPAVDVHAILACARYALSRSENEGSGETVILKNDYLDENTRTLELVNAIHGDVEKNCQNFSLFYQPILQASDSKLIGSAAFLRWEKEPFGRISPREFLNWLEKDTSFYRLGNWILERAITEGKTLHDAHPDLLLNINLAQRQLEQPEFHSCLLNLLKDTGFPGRNLCLELTDRCRFLDPAFLKSEVLYIKSCGIKVALDGSCLLDLRLVRELPVDIIKVGREFIAGLDSSEKDRALLKALCTFANESGIRVCAEGVESEAMLSLVRNFGIYAYQGYVTLPPVPMDEFMKYSRSATRG